MKTQMTERFPGISCAWMNAEGKITTEYYGTADRESNIPVDENTMFPACSISKFITALCVMKLREQKRIDTDKPVNDYLKGWKLLKTDGSGSSASIRSLLCHTGGILDGEDAFYGLRRNDPEVTLTDILEGKTAYNNRPVREEKPQGTAFEYSDAGYCVLQLMFQEVIGKEYADLAREIIFEPLGLKNTFFASPANVEAFEKTGRMAAGYDDQNRLIPGKYPRVPDLAASGLWSTPTDLALIAKEFITALQGRSGLLRKESAQEMAAPVEGFPWTGLGLFTGGENTLVSNGWGENGQCILKMKYDTEDISVVMTNRNPGMDQASSGVECLADNRCCLN